MAAGMKITRRSSSKTYLCTEIILEILSRLPAKSLFRFRCASRSWFSLIDGDKYFIRPKALPSTLHGFYFSLEHFYHLDDVDNNNRNNIDSRLNFLPSSMLDTRLGFLPYPMEFVDSCNGLLLCRKSICLIDEIYFVCNPATKRWAALPTSPISRHRHLVCLAYDPYVSSCHYKVVFWVQSSYSVTDIYVFSSEKRECGWVKETTFQSSFLVFWALYPRRWVFRDDTLYIPFESQIMKYSLGQRTVHHVFSFPSEATTVDDEEEESSWSLCRYHIGILGGAICCGRIMDSHLRVWTLVENENNTSSSWVLKHNTVLFGIGRLLAFHPFAQVIFLEMAHGFWSYNLDRNTMVANLGGRGYLTIKEYGIVPGMVFPYTPCYTDVLKRNTLEFLHARSRRVSSSKMPLQSQRRSGAFYGLQQLGYYSQQQIHFKSETVYSQLHGPHPQQQGLYPQKSRSYPRQQGYYTQQQTPLRPQLIQHAQQIRHYQENHIQHELYENLQQHGQYLHQGLYLPSQQHDQYLHQGFYLPRQHHEQYLQPHQPEHEHHPQQGLYRQQQ